MSGAASIETAPSWCDKPCVIRAKNEQIKADGCAKILAAAKANGIEVNCSLAVLCFEELVRLDPQRPSPVIAALQAEGRN